MARLSSSASLWQPCFRLRSTKNVHAGAAYFRVNFVYLAGSNAGIVTGEMGERHRKDAVIEQINCHIHEIIMPLVTLGHEKRFWP